MPKGGRLIISTANRYLDADYAAQHPDVTPGDYALIEVTDTGTGIPAEILGNIFEPFFTTKDEGKGTGLGLSMVFGYIKQSGGHVNVYSEVGVGTTFRLYLPRSYEPPAVSKEPKAEEIPLGCGETVLVVEDNAGLRRIVARQLGDLGYSVLEVENAAAAQAVLEHQSADLLFTDIVMPGEMDGFELGRVALSRWPAMRLLLTSGFPQAKINCNMGATPPAAHLLSKPYRKVDLARALRVALDG
jgi:two-component system, cell cycle sensor histidine kinase and response regulator CckA